MSRLFEAMRRLDTRAREPRELPEVTLEAYERERGRPVLVDEVVPVSEPEPVAPSRPTWTLKPDGAFERPDPSAGRSDVDERTRSFLELIRAIAKDEQEHGE
jgi:hypothetical protein